VRSALPPKADICSAPAHVPLWAKSIRMQCKTAKADICSAKQYVCFTPEKRTSIRPRASRREMARRRKRIGGPVLASEGTGRRSNERLFAFVRARADAIVRRLCVHNLIRVIFHGARDPLDAVKLIGARWKCTRGCFVISHFKSPFVVASQY
jgi:hypothetical protein